jgi:hypothetical protein
MLKQHNQLWALRGHIPFMEAYAKGLPLALLTHFAKQKGGGPSKHCLRIALCGGNGPIRGLSMRYRGVAIGHETYRSRKG